MYYQNQGPVAGGQQPGYPNGMYGYTYGFARPQAKNTQPLTPDQIAALRRNGNAFDMKVTQEDLWAAACTHKEKNGNSTLIQNADGTWTCTICHETFKMCENSREEIEAAVNQLIDMLQTSKTIYLDAPEGLVSQYYQMIPLLRKFPDLWDRAMKNFAMYEGTATGVNPMAMGYSGFNALGALMANPYGGFMPTMGQMPTVPGYPQPMPGYPQQPAAPAAPVGYPGYPTMPGYPTQVPDMTGNPMAYGAPVGVNPAPPTAPAPGVMPGYPQQPAAPAAPAAAPANNGQTEVQQQKVFNV